jgi:hypothetical protein
LISLLIFVIVCLFVRCLLCSESARIHHALAVHIEISNEKDLEPHFASLSYHFAKSRRGRNEAFKYTVKAAGQAANRGAYADGLVFANSAYNMILSALEARVLRHVVKKALGDMEQPTSLIQRLFAGQPSAKEKEALAKEKEQKQAYATLKADLDRTVEELSLVVEQETSSQAEEDGPSALYREQLYAIEQACMRTSMKLSGKNSGRYDSGTGETKKSSMSVNIGDEMDLSFTPPPSTKSRNTSLNNEVLSGLLNTANLGGGLLLFGESMKGSAGLGTIVESSRRGSHDTGRRGSHDTGRRGSFERRGNDVSSSGRRRSISRGSDSSPSNSLKNSVAGMLAGAGDSVRGLLGHSSSKEKLSTRERPRSIKVVSVNDNGGGATTPVNVPSAQPSPSASSGPSGFNTPSAEPQQQLESLPAKKEPLLQSQQQQLVADTPQSAGCVIM